MVLGTTTFRWPIEDSKRKSKWKTLRSRRARKKKSRTTWGEKEDCRSWPSHSGLSGRPSLSSLCVYLLRSKECLIIYSHKIATNSECSPCTGSCRRYVLEDEVQSNHPSAAVVASRSHVRERKKKSPSCNLALISNAKTSPPIIGRTDWIPFVRRNPHWPIPLALATSFDRSERASSPRFDSTDLQTNSFAWRSRWRLNNSHRRQFSQSLSTFTKSMVISFINCTQLTNLFLTSYIYSSGPITAFF